MLTKEILKVLENHDMNVYDRTEQDGKFYREVEFWSPTGEDVVNVVWYDGTAEGFIEGFKECAESFDPDEHAEMWIEYWGKRGVPNSIRTLIDDAEAIDGILYDTACELENLI